MENDRELLEYAAKAAGLNVQHMALSGFNIMSGYSAGNIWNPLTDDGDALRLAVKLNMEIDCGRTSSIVFRGHIGQHVVEQEVESDPYSATRRAIVRAAAEIGKQMNGT